MTVVVNKIDLASKQHLENLQKEHATLKEVFETKMAKLASEKSEMGF